MTTSDAFLAQKIRELAVHGSPKRYVHNQIGYNSRLDAIQAAILNVKLNSISKWIESRKKVANNYFNLIKKNDFLLLPEINTKLSSNSWVVILSSAHAMMASLLSSKVCKIGDLDADMLSFVIQTSTNSAESNAALRRDLWP